MLVLPNYAENYASTIQPRPQGFSPKKWVGPHPCFKGKALGTRLSTIDQSLPIIDNNR